MAWTPPAPMIGNDPEIATRERDPMTTDLARPAAAEAALAGTSDLLKTQAERRAELRRMRTIATMLLVLMAAIYLLLRRAPAGWAWAPYLSAFAEAGMVGACADWFAVVALFRRPLGLPIPHTAVVPENKRRIGAALGRFITNNFFSPRVAIARLSSVDAAGLAAKWLARRAQRAGGRGRRRTDHSHALDLVPKAAIDEWVAFAARRGIEAVPARAARLARARDPVGARRRPDAARPGARFRRGGARAQQGDDRREPCRRSPRASSPNGSTT